MNLWFGKNADEAIQSAIVVVPRAASKKFTYTRALNAWMGDAAVDAISKPLGAPRDVPDSIGLRDAYVNDVVFAAYAMLVAIAEITAGLAYNVHFVDDLPAKVRKRLNGYLSWLATADDWRWIYAQPNAGGFDFKDQEYRIHNRSNLEQAAAETLVRTLTRINQEKQKSGNTLIKIPQYLHDVAEGKIK